MSAQNALARTLDSVATYAGFSKKSGAWYLRQAQTIGIIELQKSQYGPEYYVNVALWLLALGDSQFPREHKCHIRTRLDQLFPEQEARLKQILDLDCPMDEAAREAQFRAILENHLLPVLAACSTLGGLKSGEGARLVRSSLVTIAAQKLLGLEVKGPQRDDPGRGF